MKSNLMLDADALSKMGLHTEVIYLIEYDLPNKHKEDIGKGFNYSKEDIEFFRNIRNWLMYQLKFKLMATKNLMSSWLIPNDKLELAKNICEHVVSELQAQNYARFANRVKIIKLVTDEDGFETYEDRKAECLLEWLEGAQRQVDKGIKDKTMSESVLWRCKKEVEAVEAISETLKQNKRFKELIDTLAVLDDTIHRYEAIKRKKKAKSEKTKGKNA